MTEAAVELAHGSAEVLIDQISANQRSIQLLIKGSGLGVGVTLRSDVVQQIGERYEEGVWYPPALKIP